MTGLHEFPYRCAWAGAVSMMWLMLPAPSFAGKIKTYVDPKADFRAYRTYQWIPTRVLAKSGIVEDDPVIAPVVKESVNRELTSRGLREVTEGGDLQVITCVLDTHVPQLEAYIFPLGGAMDYATPIASMGRYNREGTLAISLMDTAVKKSAWAGLITESIDNKAGAGTKKIPKATESLFRKYPVKKHSAGVH